MGCQSEKKQRRPPEKQQQQQEVTGSSKNLPFVGKSFYLDLPNNKNVEFLVAAIKQLGGVIESFLSKEVSYVVSNGKEAKLDSEPQRQTEKWSSTASGAAKTQALPSVSKGSHVGHRPKPADSTLISRGKKLLQKAMGNQVSSTVMGFPSQQASSSGSSILASARSWGVRIWHVDEMMAYVQQLQFHLSGARKQSEKMMVKSFSMGPGVLKVGKLKPPFLKIEDQSRKFRPFLHQFKSFPELNFLAPNRSSPFEPLKTPSSSCRVRAPEGCLTDSERERSPRSSPAAMPKRRKGFCECCQETFGELQMHLQSPRHWQFALDASQYAAVDHIIAQLTSNFAEIPAWSSPPRVPCSPAADDEPCGSQVKAMGSLSALAAELGWKHQLARENEAQLNLCAMAGEGVPGWECSRGLEEMSKEKVTELPSAPELLAGHPLLGARRSANAGPAGRARAWCGNTHQSAAANSTAEAAALAAAPALSQWTFASDGLTGEAAACSGELVPRDAPKPPSPALGGAPCSRKRKLSHSPRRRLEKKQRLQLSSSPLHLEKQTGSGCWGVGLAAEAATGSAPSGAPGAELCSFPASVTPQDPAHVLPEPVPMAIDGTQAPLASTATQQGWERAIPGLQEGQSTEQAPEPPCCVAESGLERQSPPWANAGSSAVHPASPHLPIPQAERLCCTGVVDGAPPEPPASTDLGKSLATYPSILQPALCSTHAGADRGQSPSSSESDWDVRLLCSLDALQGPRKWPADLEGLRRTRIDVRDRSYESQLYSVLKQKSELDLSKDEQSCWNCRAETGAPFAVFEACLGSWTS